MASSLTIAPSLGHSLVTAQGMAGGYDAIDDRSFWQVGLQEGVVGAGDFMVTERGAGANLTVDVACNTGFVVVQGDTVTNQGLYVVRPHTAVANLDIATAHGTNPRVDSVVVQVDDDEHDSSGNTRARVMVLTGTATGGATLDNRTGAPALPNSALLLADVLVPATDTSISNSQIRDRRKWANGVAWSYARESGADIGTTSTTFIDVDSTNLKPRLECSGKAVEVTLATGGVFSTVSADDISVGLTIDGDTERERIQDIPTNGQTYFPYLRWVVTPAAGSHVFAFRFKRASGTGTVTIRGNAASPLYATIRERVVASSANNTTTTG